MKKIGLSIASLFLLITLHAQQPFAGVWKTGDDNTLVETYQKDGAWFGKIISSDNTKAVIGTDILRDFKEKNGTWKGQLYAPKKDKLMNAVIKPSTNKLEIEVSAGMITKDLEWTRQEPTKKETIN